MRNLLIIIFVLVTNNLLSQNYSQLRHVQNDSFSIDFYVSASHETLNYKDTVVYAWYKSKKVMFTQGQSSGDILNGSYKKYYTSGQFSEFGNYAMGLKEGKWRKWDENGLLISISNYKRGQLHGKHYTFIKGNLGQVNKYRKGKLKAAKTKKTETQEKKQSFLKNLFKKKEKRKWFAKKNETRKQLESKKKSTNH